MRYFVFIWLGHKRISSVDNWAVISERLILKSRSPCVKILTGDSSSILWNVWTTDKKLMADSFISVIQTSWYRITARTVWKKSYSWRCLPVSQPLSVRSGVHTQEYWLIPSAHWAPNNLSHGSLAHSLISAWMKQLAHDQHTVCMNKEISDRQTWFQRDSGAHLDGYQERARQVELISFQSNINLTDWTVAVCAWSNASGDFGHFEQRADQKTTWEPGSRDWRKTELNSNQTWVFDELIVVRDVHLISFGIRLHAIWDIVELWCAWINHDNPIEY